MSRVFSPEFKDNFGGQFAEDDLRFRMPEGASNLQCRLGIEKIGDKRKGQSYPVIEMIREEIGHVLYCTGIGKKGECPSGGWCKQLSYDDVTVKNSK